MSLLVYYLDLPPPACPYVTLRQKPLLELGLIVYLFIVIATQILCVVPCGLLHVLIVLCLFVVGSMCVTTNQQSIVYLVSV